MRPHTEHTPLRGSQGRQGMQQMARQVMTGGAAWQGRMKQQTMQADANEKSALATHVLATW